MGDMKFVEKLDKLRKARGLSQSDLADAAKISQPRISEWRREESRGPTLPVALTLARTLGVSLDYLADDAQDDPPAPAVTADEMKVIELVRELGVPEARRRLLQAPAVVDPQVRSTAGETAAEYLARKAAEEQAAARRRRGGKGAG